MDELSRRLHEKNEEKRNILDKIASLEAGKNELQNQINQLYIDGAEVQGQIKLIEEMIAEIKPEENQENIESEAK